MPLVSMRQLLDHAAEHDYGHPAYNVTNIEQIHGVMRAARKVDAPVILQYSRGARKYTTDIFVRHLIDAVKEEYADIPFAVHQDHGNGLEACVSAVALGFSSVMMDGSLEADGKTPSSFEYNAAITRQVVDTAHAVGVSVEGELGSLGSLETGTGDQEDGHGFEGKLDLDRLLTNPDEAVKFVEATKVDALAVAIGTSHGAYKFTRKPTGDILAIDRIREINERLPSTHIVMHGSSSVPESLQEIINKYGGEIPTTFGVPIEEIQRAIKFGVRKVNIDTDLRMAFTAGIRQVLSEKPSSFDPREYLKAAADGMEAVCIERYEQFGAAGKASKVASIALPDMAKRYAQGAL